MVKRIVIKIIRGYQIFISPLLGESCRFYPSCSEYFILSVEKKGLLRGSFSGIKRILRCNPFFEGGIDLP